MEYHDLHISSFDWCNGIAISARAHVKPKQQWFSLTKRE